MKVFVALAALCVCASASYAPTLIAPVAKVLSSGTSQSSRTQDSNGNYAFQYNEQHSTGGSSRQESGNGWAASGSYSLNVGDGRQRVVKYIADGAGFRAAISTNEPGTAAAPAADTAISSPYAPPQPVEPLPVPVVAAPVAPVALAAPAPVAVTNGWGQQWAEPAPLAVPAPAPVAVTNGWGQAALPALPALAAPALAVAAPVAVAPAVSSYSTSINHVAPAKAVAVAAPALAIPAVPALAPAPIVQAPLSGWN